MTAKNTMKLDERALLVKLSIGRWSASKADNEVSKEVIESKQATKGAGYFRKRLINREAFKPINKVADAARITHNTLTLPWDDNGARIITTEQYKKYSDLMRDYRRNFETEVGIFIKKYKEFVKQAKEELGSMFDPEDYPTVDEVKFKFHFDVEPSTIPMSHDFRAKVSNQEVAIITKDIERRTSAKLEAAIKDVWQRIADACQTMSDKLNEYKPRKGLKDAEGVFRNSLVENIEALVDVLPGLNINNDPTLSQIAKDMKVNLCKFTPEELRGDVKARQKTAKEAQRILNKVSGFLA